MAKWLVEEFDLSQIDYQPIRADSLFIVRFAVFDRFGYFPFGDRISMDMLEALKTRDAL